MKEKNGFTFTFFFACFSLSVMVLPPDLLISEKKSMLSYLNSVVFFLQLQNKLTSSKTADWNIFKSGFLLRLADS